MLKTKVKASSITNLTDARYFAAWEVEWLGFDLNTGSTNYIEPHLVKAIKEWVDGVKIVGEFELSSPDRINEMVEALGLDGAQLGMFTPIETFQELEFATILFKEIVIEKDTNIADLKDQLATFAPYVKAFLLNFDKNGISAANLQEDTNLSKEALQMLCEIYPILLDLHIPPSNLADYLDTTSPLGLSVKGGAEEKVGFKSFDELDEVFEALEIEE